MIDQVAPAQGLQAPDGVGDSAVPDLATWDLAAYLKYYGLDGRSRSALHALGRLPGLAAARDTWVAELADLLARDRERRSVQDDDADGQLRDFIDLYFQLPVRDFDQEWLNEIAISWHALYSAGWDVGLPMRVAYWFGRKCIEVLRRGRESFSRIDAEIALAIGTSGIFVCDLLMHKQRHANPARRPQLDATADMPGCGEELRQILSSVLATAGSRTTGLLLGDFEAGSSAAKTFDDDGWSVICSRALTHLRGVLRERDLLYRIGRARFAVVLPSLTSEAQVMLAANKLARAFEGSVQTAGQTFRLLARIGAAWAPSHGRSPSALLRCANLALNEALRRRKTVEIFDTSVLEEAESESQIEDDFVRALDHGALELHYQPQIDLQSGRCTGAEALLRWSRGSLGNVPPPKIIQVAERLGMTPKLTSWILHHACRAAADFARLGVVVEIGVNLTAADVADPELPLAVRNAMKLWHVEPALLKFELTETAMLADEEVSARVITSLRELGVGTSIDDFGTGYSSVILLKKLPLNELKLDRSFVAGAAQSRQDREIVRALIMLAHSLGLEVVAEGVEDTATLDLLRNLRCDRAQGFLFSRAVPAKQFLEWVKCHTHAAEACVTDAASCSNL